VKYNDPLFPKKRNLERLRQDRRGPYAEGICCGAPQAREVPDRCHLVSSLRHAVQQELGRLRRFLVVPHRVRLGKSPDPAPMDGESDGHRDRRHTTLGPQAGQTSGWGKGP
jgi:hypothetical protein